MATASRRFLAPLGPRDRREPHRVATPLEVFFDLVAVIAIAAAAAGLHHALAEGHAAEGVVGFGFAFFAIWWAWMNYTWFASAYDNGDSVFRLLTMVIMAGALTGELAAVAISAMVTAFALWWLYFSDEEHLATEDRNRAFVWGYGHFLIFAAGASAGAGFAVQVDVLTEHAHLTQSTADLAVAIPVALYMLGFWMVRDRYCLQGPTRLVLVAAAVLALATPLAPHTLPALAALAVLAAVARNDLARRSARRSVP